MTTRSFIPVLVILSLLICTQTAFSLRRVTVEWEPAPLIEDHEAMVTIFGSDWVLYSWDSIVFNRQEFVLNATFYDTAWVWEEEDEIIEFQASHNWGELEAGEYTLWVDVNLGSSWDGEFFRSLVYHRAFQVEVFRQSSEIGLELAQGWNLSSLYVEPLEADIPTMFSALLEDGTLQIVKDFQGNFYLPARNFNNIPNWDFHQGYFIRLSDQDELQVEGINVPFDEPIPLRYGWNIAAYFPDSDVEAPDAFRNIVNNIIMVKDGDGHFYIPERNFNNLPPLIRGQGYQIKVNDDVDLIWFVP